MPIPASQAEFLSSSVGPASPLAFRRLPDSFLLRIAGRIPRRNHSLQFIRWMQDRVSRVIHLAVTTFLPQIVPWLHLISIQQRMKTQFESLP